MIETIKEKNSDFIELSVVVPVYGAEKYLEECLVSILDNSIDKRVEVIAINDESPDSSGEILDRLAKEYDNLIVVHQDNRGGAATINRGLEMARGKYVTIVDNDDWLKIGAIDIWLHYAYKHNADVVITYIIKKWANKEEVAFDTRYIKKEEVLKAHQKPAIMNDGMYLGKVFKKNFLNEKNIRMDPSLLYADRPFVVVALAEASKIALIPKGLYYWRQREDNNSLSITDQMYDIDNIKDRIRSIRIMKFELLARGYSYWLDTIDYFNLFRLFWTIKEKKYNNLKKFASITRAYFNEVNLNKLTNLTPAQKYMVNSIRDNSDEVFAILYLIRIYSYKVKNIPNKIKNKFIKFKKNSLKDILMSQINSIVLRLKNKKTKNPLKKIEFLEDYDPQIIVFESNFGKIYGAQPKYIYEELLKQKRAFRAVWVYQGKEKHKNIPGKNVVQVHRGSKEYFHYLARAGYWVNNIRFTVTYKPSHTIYLNTWHGTPLKKLGLDIEVEGPEAEARESFLKESRQWDYLLAQNEFAAKTFKRAFDVKGKVLTYGYPANEIFYKENLEKLIEKYKEKVGIKDDRKVILYAPTWRDDKRKGDKWEYSFELMLDLERMEEEFGNDYILLLRMHHLISDNLDLSKFNNFIIDVSKYDDTSEILAISDLLITDYSSIFFDYASLKRPMIFYMYDKEKYASKLRGFYLDIEKDLPGPVVEDFEQLIDIIRIYEKNINYYKDIIEEFYNKYCSLQDDKISEKVVNEVFNKIPKIDTRIKEEYNEK